MRPRTRHGLPALALGLAIAAALLSWPAGAADLDALAFGGPPLRAVPFGAAPLMRGGPPPSRFDSGQYGRPVRRVAGDTDYAGSDFGLGKPSFWGLSPRPDWGRLDPDW